MTEREGSNFLSRWSARKRAVEREERETPRMEPPQQPAGPVVLDAEISPAEDGSLPQVADKDKLREDEEAAANRAAAEAVDLDTLQYESDYAVFFKRGVPQALKNRALRKLWSSNPVLANIDGLNDYDEDFADPALNVFRSTWQVGRGFLTDEDDLPKTERVARQGAPTAGDVAPGAAAHGEAATGEARAGEAPDRAEEEVASGQTAGVSGEAGDDQGNAGTGQSVEEAGGEQTIEEEVPVRVSLRQRLFGEEGQAG